MYKIYIYIYIYIYIDIFAKLEYLLDSGNILNMFEIKRY